MGSKNVRWSMLAVAVVSVGVFACSAAPARGQFIPFDPYWHPYAPTSPWLPPPVAYPVPVPVLPRSVRIATEVIPDPELPPAKLQFVNSTRDPLRVEIVDLKRGQVIGQKTIDPAGIANVTLPRDAGGQAIETYRTYDPRGDVSEREVTRRIEPEVRYEVVVHRWQLQSIAIDRTGKSPSAVEDVQFSGQAIGRFRLPAGATLIDGRIDVYQAAIGAANADSVAPIFPSDVNASPPDPLREALQQIGR
jgi:hypothetical protein